VLVAGRLRAAGTGTVEAIRCGRAFGLIHCRHIRSGVGLRSPSSESGAGAGAGAGAAAGR
jgi:hypothetical protein